MPTTFDETRMRVVFYYRSETPNQTGPARPGAAICQSAVSQHSTATQLTQRKSNAMSLSETTSIKSKNDSD